MRENHGRSKSVAVLVAAAAVVAGGSIAWAAIPDGGGVFHACVGDNGLLRLIDTEAGETCNPKKAHVSWSQTGPQGPPGAQGQQGPPGPPGLPDLELVHGSGVTIEPSDPLEAATVTCPVGKRVLGGGWEKLSFTPGVDFVVEQNAAFLPTSWTVEARLLSSGGFFEFRATAVCASVVP